MDVGPTKVKIGRKQTVGTSVVSSGTLGIVERNLLKDSVASSKLSSLLSSLIEPIAAAPRMPQQSGPRNGSEEEKAALPQPLATPTFSIPPHVMGRNIENPVDDLVAHGRRLQKPRLGVKVPYRNLTSQIVTQDEIAQEILERSLKKHPVHDTPERGDIFFAIKLTQRLASRLTPSSNTGVVPAVSEASPGKSAPFQAQQSLATPQPSETYIIPDYPLNVPVVPEQMQPLPDQELLAILEGDVDPNWAAEVKPLSVANTRVEHYSHHTNTIKLDPVLEKELALKQLMEFQTSSRKKKEKPQSAIPNKPVRKPRVSLKRELQVIESETSNNTQGHASSVDSSSSSSNRSKNISTRSETNKSKTSSIKTRKRKLQDDVSNIALKKSRIERKIPDAVISQVNGEQKRLTTPRITKKTEGKVRKQKVDSKTAPSLLSVHDAHGTVCKSEISATDKDSTLAEANNLKPKRAGTSNGSGNKLNVEGGSKGKSLNSSPTKPKDLNVFSFYGKRDSRDKIEVNSLKALTESTESTISKSIQVTPTTSTSVPEVSLVEPQPHFFAPPIRTYSPKKGVIKPAGTSPQASVRIEQSPVKARIDLPSPKLKEEPQSSEPKIDHCSPKSLITVIRSKGEKVSNKVKDDQMPLKSKVEASSGKLKGDICSLKTAAVSTPSPEKKLQTSREESVKRRRMKEIDKLLQDEGAINILYDIEKGDTKRRSCISEVESSSRSGRVVRGRLKSIRRKKRDLILMKTRLVKNAVLRLTDSSSVSLAPVRARIKRQSQTHVALKATSQHQSKHISPVRKRSVDSHESLRSPPPLTPLDSPSPSQSFTYPPRLPLAAEASRIIRRHSSSSNFSSRSTSPSNVRLSIDTNQPVESTEKKPDTKCERTLLPVTPSGNVPVSKQGSSVRKRGVPIFVRKVESVQTYTPKGKKKKDVKTSESASVNLFKTVVPNRSVGGSSEQGSKEMKTGPKVQTQTSQKTVGDKKRALVTNKMSATDKAKLKVEMSKNFQKGLQKVKGPKLKKKASENVITKAKKKEDATKDKVAKVKKGSEAAIGEVSDLNSCLASVASAFAAEGKVGKKGSGSNGTSHTSSPCPSRSSKSPTPSRPPLLKKEPRLAAPLSPNAATYSNLIKTLENENQKQRKKDGEEITKQRSSVRQNAGTFNYHEICLRRYDNLVQVILTPQCTKMKNALNIQVLRELRDALQQLRKDDMCRAVLVTSTGSSFCQGVDLYSLIHSNAERRKTAAQELAQALNDTRNPDRVPFSPYQPDVQVDVGLNVVRLWRWYVGLWWTSQHRLQRSSKCCSLNRIFHFQFQD
ncbi:enolase-phosphatase E1 isoform X2 [Anabrus simplex]|uniref:enolase-phosphatase E1 isoform X2 n=1 Tax=Anabrus simplex TaxID=316456 RepID=UPI0035A3790D